MTIFATIASVAISFAALVITLVNAYYTKRHNILSVRPILHIDQIDTEKTVSVVLNNYGVGPLLIKQASFHYTKTGLSTSNLISLMAVPPPNVKWTTYLGIIKDYVIYDGKSVPILTLSGEPSDKDYSAFREKIRDMLGHVEATIEYTDVYGSRLPSHNIKFTWFLRENI